MRFLEVERSALHRYSPGMDEALAGLGIEALERTPSPGLSIFRAHGGARLLSPTGCGGQGASALDALRYQIALGSRAPSLAVATTMHQYKIAALVVLMRCGHELTDILSQIARNDWLVASGGAEGEPGRKLYQPAMTARDSEDGLLVSGTKKPCCLTWSMDLLSVMLRSAPESRYGGELLHILIDPTHPSVKRQKFWTNTVLAATESDAVTLDETPARREHIFRIGSGDRATPFALAAFLWFELLACGAYLGIAAALVSRMLEAGKGDSSCRADVAIEYDTLLTALEYVALQLDAGVLDEALLSRMFRVRYAAEKGIPRIAAQCLDALGGLSFSQSYAAGYLALATRALAFHTPSRASMTDNLAAQLVGENLILS